MRMKTESHKSMKTDHLIKCHIHVFVFLSLWGLAFSDLTTSQRTRNHGNSLFNQINVRTKVLNSRHPHFSCNMCILVLTIKQAQEDTHTHLNQPSNNAFYQRSAKKRFESQIPNAAPSSETAVTLTFDPDQGLRSDHRGPGPGSARAASSISGTSQDHQKAPLKIP